MKITEARIDGDFRSKDCTTLLKESDIVVTNPPFSLFRDFFKWLMNNEKDFIIVGNQNAIAYKEVFPYLKEDKVKLGSQTGCKKMEFVDATNEDALKPFGNICWYTTVDLNKHHEPLLLTERYSPEKYPKYDNYDAIEVSKVDKIPCDYFGVMGVPITYMYKHNSDQFELIVIACGNSWATYPDILKSLNFNPNMKYGGGLGSGIVDGKAMYARLFIRRKQSK